MSGPLVTIVTPTYNQAAYVAETIESVLAQSYPHIEYLVFDDGSTDETPDVLKRYAGAAGHLTIERHQNIGQTATINKGFARARGDILAWINSDDVYTPDAVAEAVEALAAQPAASMVYGNCDNVDADGHYLSRYPARPETLESLLFSNEAIGISQPSSFWRRRVLDEVGFLDPLIYYCMDLDYWLRILLRGEMAYIDGQPWSKYRVHAAAKTSAQLPRSAADFVYVYRKIAACASLPQELRARSTQIIAYGHFLAARRCQFGGASRRASDEAWTSLRLAPTQLTLSKLRLLLMSGEGQLARPATAVSRKLWALLPIQFRRKIA
jgi:glycosyltransferase involved in cell wall biosynthesis